MLTIIAILPIIQDVHDKRSMFKINLLKVTVSFSTVIYYFEFIFQRECVHENHQIFRQSNTALRSTNIDTLLRLRWNQYFRRLPVLGPNQKIQVSLSLTPSIRQKSKKSIFFFRFSEVPT